MSPTSTGSKFNYAQQFLPNFNFFRSVQFLSKVTHSSALKNLWSWMNCLQENRPCLDRPTQRNGTRRGAACVFLLRSSASEIAEASSSWDVGPRCSVGKSPSAQSWWIFPASHLRFLRRDRFSYKLGPWKSLLPSFAKMMRFPCWMMINWETLEKMVETCKTNLVIF